MDTIQLLMQLFLEEKMAAPRFKEAMFSYYYNSGLYDTLDKGMQEQMDVLMLSINMYEESDYTSDGLIHFTEEGLRQHIRNIWPEFFKTDPPSPLEQDEDDIYEVDDKEEDDE